MAPLDLSTPRDVAAETLFAGPGEMRARCRAFDWAATPLGPVARWPQSLKTAVDLCLGSVVPSFIWWGSELTQLYNDSARAIVHAKHPASLGQPARIAWADVWPALGQVLENVVATGEAVREDDLPIVLDRDGLAETTWFTFSCGPVRDEQGAVAGVFCTAIETTLRVRAEAMLRASARVEEALQHREAWLAGQEEAIQQSLNGASLADSLGVLVRTALEQTEPGVRCAFYLANDEKTELTHVTGMSESYAECIGGFQIGPNASACGLTMYTGQAVVTPDVTTEPLWKPWLWLAERYAFRAVWSFPIEPVPGEVIGTFAMYFTNPRAATKSDRDAATMVTRTAAIIVSRAREADERVRAEVALRESEVRFRAVANLVPDLLWQSEPDGSILWCNARWLEYTGQTLAEARGWGWMETIHPDDSTQSVANYVAATSRGVSFVREYRICRHDGAYRWFLVRAEPLRDDKGQIVCWFGAATDIHAQRKAFEEVERLVAERTAERDLLRRHLAEAEEAERRRLARELHDQLGQELTAFRLGLDDAARLAREAVPNEALLARIDGLALLASRMTAGARAIALELRPPELDDVGLEDALHTYVREWAGRYGIAAEVTITSLYDGHPVPEEVASALYRIAQEALTNIAKHANASHISVIGGCSNGELRLVIEDDGRGFDVAAAATQAKSARRLGVAGMQERAALVGGTVDIESHPGSGTTLYVRLPTGEVATTNVPRTLQYPVPSSSRNRRTRR